MGKMIKIDDHVFTAISGLTEDANHLVDVARYMAQQHTYTYKQPLAVE